MITDAENEGKNKLTLEEANKRIYLVDSQGLVTKGRAGLNAEKLPYAHEHANIKDLAEIVDSVKPTCLFGVAAIPQVFTEAVCRNMAKHSSRPLIFALSNPTSKAECTAEQAYKWTKGTCLFASGSPFDPVTIDGTTYVPGQGNNSYIFPGLSLAVIATGARRVTDSMFLIAAATLAKLVPQSQLDQGTLYPELASIRSVSADIAAAVGEEVYRLGLATYQPKPEDMRAYMVSQQYSTRYDSFVH
jgi:malate dehydrogenase (oxaloacetate-decarboxylating)(NADP+)